VLALPRYNSLVAVKVLALTIPEIGGLLEVWMVYYFLNSLIFVFIAKLMSPSFMSS